jgi:hypothetical protein
MTFIDLMNDVKKLVGLELQSIRPGANIVIEEVDDARDCLILRTSKGETRSRPFSELRAIYDELQKSAAVHVEGVLHGSGTSRNQPETILANLPYIEWLKIDNKKHIAYIGRNNHPFGTLKQMPSVQAAELLSEIRHNSNAKNAVACIVADAVNESINTLRDVCGGTIRAISQNNYALDTAAGSYYFVTASSVDLEAGVYLILAGQNKAPHHTIIIDGTCYSVIAQNGIKALTKS